MKRLNEFVIINSSQLIFIDVREWTGYFDGGELKVIILAFY